MLWVKIIMMNKFNILKKIPFWHWVFIFLMPKYFERFPTNCDEHGKWMLEVYRVYSLGGICVYREYVECKMSRAYAKVRLKALEVDWSTSGGNEVGITYVIKKQKDESADDDINYYNDQK